MSTDGIKVRRRTEVHEAWQFNGWNSRRPAWVVPYVRLNADNVVLERRSGRQVIEVGDWLVRDLDGAPAHYTDEQFWRSFERVSD